jgi:hypothetical protein
VPIESDPLSVALLQVHAEAERAGKIFAPFNSAHEGYAVLAEEVDELWQHVKVKQGKRDVEAMIAEAKQVAAMALRFMVDLQGERGQR